MDYELFEEASKLQNFTGSEVYEISSPVYSILYGFVCSLGILGDLLIVLAVLKYSYMKTPTNLYILHWAIFNVLFLFHFIYFYVVKRRFTLLDLYISYELEAILEVAIVITLLLLIFDRCVEDDITSQRLPIFVWFFMTMCIIITHRWHLLQVFQIGRTCLCIATIVVVVIKQILYVIRKKKKRVIYSKNRKIRLVLVSVYMYTWGNCWGCYYLIKHFHDYDMRVAALISIVMGLVSSIVNVILLSYLDVNFKTAFMNVLTCRSSNSIDINIQGYEDEDKDSDQVHHRAVFIL